MRVDADLRAHVLPGRREAAAQPEPREARVLTKGQLRTAVLRDLVTDSVRAGRADG